MVVHPDLERGRLAGWPLSLSIKLCIEIPNATLARIALLRLCDLIADQLRLTRQGHQLPLRSKKMNEPLALCAAQKFQLLEILHTRKPNGERVRPGTKAVLYLLADCRAALHWSNARIAEKIGYSLRTVARAMAELREAGILTSFRKRRETSWRYLHVSKAVELMSLANQFIKEKCAAAYAAIRCGQEVPRMARSNHWYEIRLKKVGSDAPRLVQAPAKSDLSPDLERALARLGEGIRQRADGR